jgi:hypothetical protein
MPEPTKYLFVYYENGRYICATVDVNKTDKVPFRIFIGAEAVVMWLKVKLEELRGEKK